MISSVAKQRCGPMRFTPELHTRTQRPQDHSLRATFPRRPTKTLRWSFAGLIPGRLLDELMQRIRQFAVLIGAALAQLSRYLFGNVANPTFREVKANDANRALVLAFQQIVDDGLKIGVFNVCLAPGTTQAEVVEDQIDIPVGGRTNYSGCATHLP